MQVVNESLNPVWNQTFDFVVEDGLHDMLILEVWDHDTFGKVVFYQQFCTFGKLSSFFFFFFKLYPLPLQDYMGRCILTLTRVLLEGEYKESFELDGAKSGKLNLHLKWTPQPIYRDS